jgi:asparagine synthase (glutamine-hydrolysing)
MCGIAGFYGAGSQEDLFRMIKRLFHRGPDTQNHAIIDGMPLYLGHTRLSILDSTHGVQPMWSPDRQICVVYNGEIYNAGALRRKLESRGHNFRTDHSDTEVLVHGYREWGRDLVAHLNGMFAFAIYDRARSKLFFARDRFGEKPLFWARQEDGIIFASELPALMLHPSLANRDLDPVAIRKFFAYSLFPGRCTPYRNVEKLEPGTWLEFDLSTGELTQQRYWRYAIEPSDPQPSPKQILSWEEELEELLSRAVERRLQSDVPLGIFLSGGIDSSAVLSMMCRHRDHGSVKAFAIGFAENSYDESEFATLAANHFNVDIALKQCSITEAIDLVPGMLARIGEPVADSSIIPTSMLCQFARERITVALGGDGGDELFAGYDPIKALGWATLYQNFVPKDLHKVFQWLTARLLNSKANMSFDFKLKRTLRGLSYDRPYWLPVWMGALGPADLEDLFHESVPVEQLYEEAIYVWNRSKSSNLVDRASEYFVNFYLSEGVLMKTDRASMQASLEVRAPFLDKDLADFSCRLPSSVKFREGKGKWILRKALSSKLPNEIIKRPKKGFGVPLGDWVTQLDLHPNESVSNLGRFGEWSDAAMQVHKRRKGDYKHALWSNYALNQSLIKLSV